MKRCMVTTLLGLLLVPAAQAQLAYRCGNTYSDEPCPQARRVDIGDARTDAQRAEALRLAAADQRRADDMSRERLAHEAADRAANAKSPKPKPAKRPHASKIRWFRP